MQNFVSRTTQYKRRIRSSATFSTIPERPPTPNNDPLHYTFGDDFQNHLGFNIDQFNDNLMEDVDRLYIPSDSPSSTNNEEEAPENPDDDDGCNDDDVDDLCSLKSFESEYTSVRDIEDEVSENIE